MNMQQLRNCAERGDLHRMALLAWEYAEGKKIRRSYVKAFFWYTEAVIRGSRNHNIYHNVGTMYWDGNGVKRDIRKSFLWLYKGAEAGDLDCMLATGWNYLNGKGTTQDYQKAEHWYKQALKLDPACVAALFSLGCIEYMVAQNYRKACDFFSKAYQLERHVRSGYMLGRMFATGLGVTVDLDAAGKFLKYASRHGCYEAKRFLQSNRFHEIVENRCRDSSYKCTTV